ncbi:hypothetical protein FGB62_683g00, partial [Gracilaria domingensis]
MVRSRVPSNFWYREVPKDRDRDVYIKEKNRGTVKTGFDLGTPSQMRLGVLALGEAVTSSSGATTTPAMVVHGIL